MVDMRIYVIEDKSENGIRLVKAASRAQAVQHVVSQRYSAKPASVNDIAELVGGGMPVETANGKAE